LPNPKSFLPAVVAALCATSVAGAATTINVGSYLLLPNTPDQVIQIPVSGSDLAPGADLAVQVGDGGPELANYGLPPGTPGPAISQIDFGAGTIFSVPGAQQFTSSGNIPQVWFTNVVLGNSPANVMANGMLANLTINTTGFSNGSFGLLLKNVVPGLLAPNGYSTDLTDQVPNLTINNGSITIIPATAYWRGNVDGNWSTNNAGVTNWKTDASGATDTHTPPGVASDVFFTTTSGASNLSTTLDTDFSIKGLTFTSAATNPATINGTHTLTLGVDGLALQNGAATATIGSAIAFGASQTWSIAGSNPLVVNGAVSLGGSTLTKAGTGTLRINGAPALGTGSALVVSAGTLRFNVASGAAVVSTGVTATIASGATLELAGSVSALAAGSNRVNVMNNSQAAAGGLLVSGTDQQVGNIDGAGTTVIGDGGNLTANHIQQSALLIGGNAMNGALVTIAASDASGNSLIAASGSSFVGVNTSGDPLGVSASDALRVPTRGGFTAPILDALSEGPCDHRLGGGATVPEPSTTALLCFGAACLVVGLRFATDQVARETLRSGRF
jgi:hypothetical protein